MIPLVIVWCMILNPTMCHRLEVAPEGRQMTSLSDCLMGGAIASMHEDGVEWTAKISFPQSPLGVERRYLEGSLK